MYQVSTSSCMPLAVIYCTKHVEIHRTWIRTLPRACPSCFVCRISKVGGVQCSQWCVYVTLGRMEWSKLEGCQWQHWHLTVINLPPNLGGRDAPANTVLFRVNVMQIRGVVCSRVDRVYRGIGMSRWAKISTHHPIGIFVSRVWRWHWYHWQIY